MQSKCCNCQVPMDYEEHHPTILDKCGHVICNKCKISSVSSKDEDSGFDNIVCPVQNCSKPQENFSKHDTEITKIFKILK